MAKTLWRLVSALLLLLLPMGGSAVNINNWVTRLKKVQARPSHAVHLIASSEGIIRISKALELRPTEVVSGINACVFIMWQLQFPWMHHFLLAGNPRIRRWLPHTYLTSGFSHIEWNHLAGNLGALLMFGKHVEDAIGTRKFVYMYISSIFVPEYLVEMFTTNRHDTRASLGASGAISAIQAYFCLRFAHSTISICGVKVKAPLACLIWYVHELIQLGGSSNIGHGAHLGGYTSGVLFYLLHDVIAPRLES